jgi:orotate phosphoribosyltransferase
MKVDTVRMHFEETGALLSGHFKLSSGLHSDRYLQCAKVLQWPVRAEALGAALAAKLSRFSPQVVVSPAMGGLIIGQEVGRGLGCRAIFAERTEGAFALRRGFALEPGERVAVVEDVVTTGKSTREVFDLVRSQGAEVVATSGIIDRRGAQIGLPIDSVPAAFLLELNVPAWNPDTCPLCSRGETLAAPGSRFLASGAASGPR